MARTLDIASRDATSGTVKSMREAVGPIDILVKIPMPPKARVSFGIIHVIVCICRVTLHLVIL
ncbi:hypothetical protein At1D1108_40050 [Agrobacterium tumefaciens]|nr:hypothetical protein At1D1108_40050 [Agrobacterium tumefaciens]